MTDILQPWQLLLAILSGWIHRRQQQIIEFQNSQIVSLMQNQGKKRILLTDEQRRLLAVKGKVLGRKTLLAPTTRGPEMELQRQTQVRGQTAHPPDHRGPDPAVRS